MLRHEPGGLPIVEEYGFAAFVGRADGRIQCRAGTRSKIVVMGIQAMQLQQARVRFLAHPTRRAVQKATLLGHLGVSEQLFVLRKIAPCLEVGRHGGNTAIRVALHDVIGHIPALLGPALQRVAHHTNAVGSDGIFDDGRAACPDLGDDLQIILGQCRFCRGRRAGHDVGAAPIGRLQ